MSTTTTINEKTTLLVTAAFFDEDGIAATPSAATYRIHDRASGTVIVAVTTLTGLGITKQIEITSAQNAMVAAGAATEEHVLTLEWDYGSGRHGSDEYRWLLRNLVGVS
jgi:hypothetical protein